MSNQTCDVVESGVVAHDYLFASVTSVVETTGFSLSFLIPFISALLMTSAVASDSATAYPTYDLHETAVATSSLITHANAVSVLTDTASATSAVLTYPADLLVEQAVASAILTSTRDSMLLALASASSTATPAATTTRSVVETARATDILFGFNDASVVEQAAATSTTITGSVVRLTITESAAATASVVLGGEGGYDVVEHARATDTTLPNVTTTVTLSDRAIATDAALLPAITLGWWMNIDTTAMARVLSMPFVSMAVVKGRVLGIGEGGLFELAGSTDAGVPIDAHVVTGSMSMGSDAIKMVTDVFIGGTTSDAMALSVSVYGAVKGTYTYTIPARDAASPRGNRTTLGKGLRSRYWKFKLANIRGADFSIDTINADVSPSTNRRI